MFDTYLKEGEWVEGDECCLLDRFNDTRYVVVSINGLWHQLRRICDGALLSGYMAGELRPPNA